MGVFSTGGVGIDLGSANVTICLENEGVVLREPSYVLTLREDTDEILAHKHQDLEEFGSGEDEDPKIWNPVIRQALIAGYLKKEVENYGLLKVTSAGKKFIKNPHSFMVLLYGRQESDSNWASQQQ